MPGTQPPKAAGELVGPLRSAVMIGEATCALACVASAALVLTCWTQAALRRVDQARQYAAYLMAGQLLFYSRQQDACMLPQIQPPAASGAQKTRAAAVRPGTPCGG